MKKQYNEIRLDKGKPDDIVINKVDFHLEQMDDNWWWLGLMRKNKRTTFWISSKSKIAVIIKENGLKTKIIE